MELRYPGKQLIPNSQKFVDTGGDVFFLIRSDVQSDVEEIYRYLENRLKKFCRPPDVTESSPPNKVHFTVGINQYIGILLKPCQTVTISAERTQDENILDPR